MKIKSIEPTPNPNSMKLNLDERLPEGMKLNYTKGSLQNCPDYIRSLFDIEGVKGVYQVADFLTLERNPKIDWQTILTQVRAVFESESLEPEAELAQAKPATGEYQVLIQMFKGIPMQIKLLSGTEDIRVALPDQFGRAAKEAVAASQNFLKERKWVDQGIRYGDAAEIGEEVRQLVLAAYDENRLKQLVERAAADEGEAVPDEPLSVSDVNLRLDDPDWRRRYAALDQLNPAQDSIDVVVKALHDDNSSIRRLAAVYLGSIGGPGVLPHLYEALKDPSVAVRRAAGDCLSDLGDPRAIRPMAEALKDSSKLVRWRAARFLYEVGDETAIEALKEAQNDPEFEVRLQVKLALERIQGGFAASGPVWQQMTKALNDSKQ